MSADTRCFGSGYSFTLNGLRSHNAVIADFKRPLGASRIVDRPLPAHCVKVINGILTVGLELGSAKPDSGDLPTSTRIINEPVRAHARIIEISKTFSTLGQVRTRSVVVQTHATIDISSRSRTGTRRMPETITGYAWKYVK